MSLILDSSILIAGERRGETVKQVLQRVRATLGDQESALSVITAVEITHGIYRAKTDADKMRRKAFADELFRDLVIHPLTLAIAQLAGRIEGEQAARGISIATEDLIIGATALSLGFGVATLNVKHFRMIPSLQVLTV